MSPLKCRSSLAVTRYAFYARGGRIDPTKLSLWLDQKKPVDIYASEVMRQIADRGDVTAALRAFHPQNPQFELLRRAYLAERGGASAPAAVIPSGPVLSRGDRGTDVPLIRKRLDVAADDGNDTLVDRRLLKAVRAFMSEQGYGRKRVIDDEVRSALSKPAQTGGAKKKALLEKYVANMERWRWAPADFGQLHIWNNLPEFETRVVRDGEVIGKSASSSARRRRRRRALRSDKLRGLPAAMGRAGIDQDPDLLRSRAAVTPRRWRAATCA